MGLFGSRLLIKCERSQIGSCEEIRVWVSTATPWAGPGEGHPYLAPDRSCRERENIKSDKLNKIFLFGLLRSFRATFSKDHKYYFLTPTNTNALIESKATVFRVDERAEVVEVTLSTIYIFCVVCFCFNVYRVNV